MVLGLLSNFISPMKVYDDDGYFFDESFQRSDIL